MGFEDTTVIVPTLNEGGNIGELIDLLLSQYPGVRVMIVDDGSQDGTAAVVGKRAQGNPAVTFLDRSSEPVHGLTASVLAGLRRCETPFFVVMDGDLQHPPERVGALVEQLRGGSPLVIGTRTRVAVEWEWYRRLMSVAAGAVARGALMLRGRPPPRDIMSGFFGGSTDFVRGIADESHEKSFELRGYKVLFDLLRVLPRDVRIAEVPYTFGARARGRSKIGYRQMVSFLRSLVR